MKTLFKLAASAFVVFAAASACQKPEGGPDTPGGSQNPLENAIEFAGKETKIQTVLVSPDEYTYYFAAEAGVQSLGELEGTDYVSLTIGPDVEGPESGELELDLTSLPAGTGMAYYEKDGLVFEVSSADHSAISEGTLTIAVDMETETTGTVDFSMLLTSGETFRGNIKLDMETIVPIYPEFEGNTIVTDGASNPVRAAFYLEEGGQTYLYFTSSEVYTFDELMEMGTNYLFIAVDDTDLGGQTIDLADSKNMSLLYMSLNDDLSYNFREAYSGDLAGAAGSYSIEKISEGEYAARISVTFGDGTSVEVSFEGACVSVDYVPEEPEKSNEFSFEGETMPIQSALVDKSDTDIWHIWMSPIGGLEYVSEYEDPANDAIHITAPAEVFNYGPVGLSTYKGILKFEYGGNVWEYKEDGSVVGTLEVYLDGDLLTVDFSDYDEFEGHYSGVAVIVE